MTDQALLAKIAIENGRMLPYRHIRKAAAERVTDQALLAKIAIENGDQDVYKAALERVTDQALLAKFAIEKRIATRISEKLLRSV